MSYIASYSVVYILPAVVGTRKLGTLSKNHERPPFVIYGHAKMREDTRRLIARKLGG